MLNAKRTAQNVNPDTTGATLAQYGVGTILNNGSGVEPSYGGGIILKSGAYGITVLMIDDDNTDIYIWLVKHSQKISEAIIRKI